MADAATSTSQGSKKSNRSNEVRSIRDIVADKNLSGSEAAMECFREYAKERPEVVAMWTFGIGFVLGWKLRIW